MAEPILGGTPRFNASTWSEDIALVSNQGIQVDYEMEPSFENVRLVENPAADPLFEGQNWGWDDIDHRSVLAQNYNQLYFKNGLTPHSLS